MSFRPCRFLVDFNEVIQNVEKRFFPNWPFVKTVTIWT